MSAAYSLTAQQTSALRFIENYLDEHGNGPSFDDIAHGLGLASKSGAARLVEALEERGAIRRLPHKARSITLATDDGVAPAVQTQARPAAAAAPIGVGDLPRPVEKRCTASACKAYYVTTHSQQQHCWNCKVRELQAAQTPAWLVESV